MRIPRGPHRIGRSGQLSLPKQALQEAGLEIDDELYVVANDDPPGTLLLIPVEILVSWLEVGRKVEGVGDEVADADR